MTNINKLNETIHKAVETKFNKDVIKNKLDKDAIIESNIDKIQETDFENFLESFTSVLDGIYENKGEISKINSANITSLVIEFVERGKVVCRAKELYFHEKVLDTIKQAVNEKKKLNLLQVAVMTFIKDMLSLSSEDLKELGYDDIVDYFYELKDEINEEYKDWFA